MLNRDYGKKSSGPQKMADGGSVGFFDSLKQLGDRLTAGNIDERGSEAYNRWNPKADADVAQSDAKFDRPAPVADTTPVDASDAQSRRVAGSSPSEPVGGYDSTDVNPNLVKQSAAPAAATVIAAPRKRARVSNSANAVSNRRDEWAYRTAQDKADAESRNPAVSLGSLNSIDSVKSGLADDLNPTKGSWLSGRADGGPVGGDRYYGKK